MKELLILGAGTSGTMMANHLRKKLPKKDWNLTIIDQEETHYYQPGFLFLPFDLYKTKDVKKKIDKFIPKGVNLINEEIERIDKDNDQTWREYPQPHATNDRRLYWHDWTYHQPGFKPEERQVYGCDIVKRPGEW